MENINTRRKLLNQQQTTLRKMLNNSDQHETAIKLFLEQHAQLHSRDVIKKEKVLKQIWSYEDIILEDLTENQIRAIPINFEHSITWCIWHLTRIEDVALNILVSGTQQIFYKDNWFGHLNVTYQDTGNEMDPRNIILLSNSIDIPALRSYRVAVGIRTREIVRKLEPMDLKKKVDPDRIKQVKDQGALVKAAYGIADYWSKRNIAGVLLMPATRHNLVHLNEAFRIKQKQR